MAEKKEDKTAGPAKGGKTKLIIIILAVLLIAGGGLAAFLLMGNDKPDSADNTAKAVKQVPIYFTVTAPFIVNFSDQSKGAVRYMQVKMKVMARDQLVIDAFKLHLPAIQHGLLMLLYSQKYDELNTSEGIKALQKASVDKINEILHAQEKLDNSLEAVYFTSFMMQ